jgi:quinol monooxygenase YgiN
MDEIVVLVDYRARPGQEAAARERIARLVAEVRAREAQCGGIRILQQLDDPSRITLVEAWPDREHFLGPHLQQPHIQAFIAEAATLFEGPPAISFWSSSPAWDRRVSMRPRD